MRTLIIFALITTLGACARTSDEAALDERVAAIRNGTNAPVTVALSPEQTLAIGWLHYRGRSGSPFCSGTLISTRMVATAKHCTDTTGPNSISFSIGGDIDAPVATYRLRAIYEHPISDSAFLELTQDARDKADVEPIRPNEFDLDAWSGLVGRLVQGGGYGRTTSPGQPWQLPVPGGSEGLLFATIRLTGFDSIDIQTDGEGLQGYCPGDSGGPLLTADEDGTPVLLGMVSRGELSCLGRDDISRLDTLWSWLVAEAPIAALPGGPCDKSDASVCDADDLWRCVAGTRYARDCSALGQTCLDDDDGVRCAPPPPPPIPEIISRDACGGVPTWGMCSGDAHLVCDDEDHMTTTVCDVDSVCVQDEDSAGCVPLADASEGGCQQGGGQAPVSAGLLLLLAVAVTRRR